MHAFARVLGDPELFVAEIPALAMELRKILGLEFPELKDIRAAVKARNYEITGDKIFRPLLGAFAVLLIDWYGQRVVVRGWFRKRVMVESKGVRCEFLDLFYRCVFEGLDLAPEGEGLPTKM
jgi:hypothetical protein